MLQETKESQGSCVTTMNIENVGSCVNNIHFVICSHVAVMIIIYPFSCWNKNTSLSIRNPFLHICESCQYVNQCL
jgi:hypothetical protein